MTNGTVCEDASFDVEAVIKEFLADSTRKSMELPHMTTGQRKQAKKAADQHPDLKCESYGFGAERTLHLFKKSWENAQEDKQADQKEVMNAVNVKNTFIDDWVGGDAQSEPIIFRSMPDGMYRNLLQQESRDGLMAGPELSPIKESNGLHSPPTEAATPSPRVSEEAELRTAASSPTVVSNLELPPELESFRVRNTFIHIEEETIDNRIVQSMPHGMFSQLVAQESAREAPARESSEEAAVPQAAAPLSPPSWHAPACLADSAGQCQFGPGTLVVVEGLVKLPAFNGLSGVIQSLDAETGRYSVLLASPTLPNGQQLAKVKGQNLRPYMLLPPPPKHAAPSVLVDAPSTNFIDVPPTPEGATPLLLTALV